MTDRTEALQEYKLYTLKELMPIIGVTHRTLLRYVKAGTLPAKKIGGNWRVTEADLKQFLQGK